MQQGYTTQHSDGTTHSKQHRTKGVQPNGSPCAKNHCSTRYEQSFRHNKYTHLSDSYYRPTFQTQSLSSSQTTSRDAKPTQHIETTHLHNVNSKRAFHKVASFHQHYSTYTLQTYHHQEQKFRSWPTQMTSPSHLHTQA